MSPAHPDVELAERLWSAVAEGDADTLAELLTEEVVWKVSGTHSLSGLYVGPDRVLEYMAGVGEAADTLQLDLTRVFVNDEGAIIEYRMHAARKGKTLDTTVLLRLEACDGRITSGLVVPIDQAENNAFWPH
ncbi:MAG: nuclear transport factor 2 family protein [bacterium]|nr:nuclear transport factor 2 family protein [bacterium]